MQTTPIGWRLQLVTGAAFALMALAAVRVDILNNWAYGLSVSSELAIILVLAAVGVVALPTAASILGWSRHLKLTTIVCVTLTVWSAINAYSTKQGAAILAAQSSQHTYESARADEELARQTLRLIKETGDAGELGRLQAMAKDERAKACVKPKSDACKLAAADEKTLTARLSDAKARDRAQATLSAAKDEAKAGPAEASMVASVIAAKIGFDAADVARVIALALTGLGIVVTQALALLGGQAATLIGGALQIRQMVNGRRRVEDDLDIADLPGSQRECLTRITALILNGNGQLMASGRKLSELTGVPYSTFAGWRRQWEEMGLIEVSGTGSKMTIRLGNKRAA